MGFFDFISDCASSVGDTLRENVEAIPYIGVGAAASTMSGAAIMTTLAAAGAIVGGGAAAGIAVVGYGCHATGKCLDGIVNGR